MKLKIMMVTMMLEDRLDHVGYQVLKTARLTTCLALAESAPINLATLDINLAGETSFPVAEVLCRRDVPLVFCSGYGDAGLPETWKGTKVLQTRYGNHQLIGVLDTLRAH